MLITAEARGKDKDYSSRMLTAAAACACQEVATCMPTDTLSLHVPVNQHQQVASICLADTAALQASLCQSQQSQDLCKTLANHGTRLTI